LGCCVLSLKACVRKDDGDSIEEAISELLRSRALENDLRKAITAHNASSDPVERAELRAAAGRLSHELHAMRVDGRLSQRLLEMSRAAREDPSAMQCLQAMYSSADPQMTDFEIRKSSSGGATRYEELHLLVTQRDELEAGMHLADNEAERSALESRVEALTMQVKAKRAMVREEEERWWRQTGEREYRAEWEFDEPPHAVGPWPGPLDSGE